MALPVPLFSAFIGLLLKEKEQIIRLPSLPLAVISLVIAIVGFFVLLYIVNLRTDAILYARTVNAIRKHFYDDSDIDIDTMLRTRVLPQTRFLPGYFEKSYFLPVVVSFALLNSLNFMSGILLLTTPLVNILGLESWNELLTWACNIPLWIWVLALIFPLFHVISYWLYALYREHAYLRSNSMGVDIDGVLNRHRYHFCDLLDEIVKKKVDPEKITTIPVHEDPKLGVSKEEENRVFNNPRYWIEMPCINDAAYNIKRMRNAFKLKIYIFTHRPWPSDNIKKGYNEWKDAASKMLKQIPLPPTKWFRWLPCSWSLYNAINKIRMKIEIMRLGLKPIDIITKCWLHHNGIEYNKLIIERASENISFPWVQFQNRFYISRKRRLRFFVEDDEEKANKLAYICDVVFLMEQPYNTGKNLPKNVLPVKSWDEIYRWIRKLS